mmetsp:Transcript_11578/g.34105  ORF Transcript_11578/g.34105 Transcript_11578/m.34105 type:complete len:739 (-) Transcript_11578:200-2416(-)
MSDAGHASSGVSTSVTSPITAADVKPRARSSRTHASARSAGTDERSPPAVCGSKRAGYAGCCTACASLEIARRSRRLAGCSDEKMPWPMHSSTPGRIGTSPSRSRTRAFEADAISSRWPSSPKPVTSVHALPPWRISASAAGAFERTIPSVAAARAAPGAAPRIAAAKRTPVPSGFVRRSASPARMPPLCIIASLGAYPMTAKPRASSAPSHVCPPSSAHPASPSVRQAPAIIWKSVASTFASSPYGTTATARAPAGGAPMAWQSERAWLAATCPKTKGSGRKERKKSTEWTDGMLDGARTAQSSGASSPTRTVWCLASGKWPSARSRAITRESTVAPTFAPQPPHRIDACESVRNASSPAAAATSGTALASGAASICGRPLVYAAIHVRSIQSLRPHSHAASRQSGPLEATAPPSPVPMMPRKRSCGVKGSSGLPSSLRRKLVARGGPCRTAKTPAFGRGCLSTAATSPAANTAAALTDSSVSPTATKPRSSSCSGVPDASQGGAPPCVHQIASSQGTSRPEAQRRRAPPSPPSPPPPPSDSMATTSSPSSASTRRSARMRSNAARTPSECCGISRRERETRLTRSADASRPRDLSSRLSRASIASASSTPPAPPPTTTTRTGGAAALAAAEKVRARIASQRAQKPSIGLTGVTHASAERATAASRSGLGADPVLMERTSYGREGRPARWTSLARVSTPVASAWMSRAPAKAASRARSMWHSRREYAPATYPGSIPE